MGHMKNKTIAILAFCLLAGVAHAQVRKCKAADGTVTYSDFLCSSSTVNESRVKTDANTFGTFGGSDQLQTGRSSDNRENCSLLKDRATKTFTSYQEARTNYGSSASFQTIQRLANYCPSSETCNLISARMQDAQRWHEQTNNKQSASSLDLYLELRTRSCRG